MTEEEQEIERQNNLLKEYLDKYFSPEKQTELIDEFSFSEIRKMLGELDIEFFARMYFPKYFYEDFGKFHTEMFAELKTILNSKGTITCFGCPRGHGKSTIDSFLFPLYSVLYRKTEFVLIISATEDIALPFLDMVKDEIENNELIKEDFAVYKGVRWNNSEIWMKSGSGLDACIMIRGIDGSLRGIHYKHLRPQLILCDDLVKDKIANSEVERQRLKDTFQSIVIPLGSKLTNILIVGTVQNEEDIMADFLKGRISGVKAIKKSAITNFSPRVDLWGEWESKYNNLKDIHRIATAKNYFEANKEEMLKDTEILWPESLTYYYLMLKKQSMGDSKFYCEYQNDPRSTDDYIFQNIQFWQSLPETKDMKIVMFVDPAIRAGKRNDFSAVTILGQHKITKQMYVIDGLLYKLLPDDLFDRLVELLNIYPYVEKIGFETTQAQSYMKQKLEEKLWSNKIYTPIDEVTPKGKKHERIITLQPDISKGFILFNRDNSSYNAQVKDYNKNAAHDDAPDSLFAAVQLTLDYDTLKFFDRSLLF